MANVRVFLLDYICGLPNKRFAFGWPFTKKTTQTATNEELSAASAESRNHRMTKTTGLRGTNHGIPKQWVQILQKYPKCERHCRGNECASASNSTASFSTFHGSYVALLDPIQMRQ